MSSEFFAGAAQGLQQGTSQLPQVINQDRDRVQRQPLLEAQKNNLEANTEDLKAQTLTRETPEEAKLRRKEEADARRIGLRKAGADATVSEFMSSPAALGRMVDEQIARTGLVNAQTMDVGEAAKDRKATLKQRGDLAKSGQEFTATENRLSREAEEKRRAEEFVQALKRQESQQAFQRQLQKEHEEFLTQKDNLDFVKTTLREFLGNEQQLKMAEFTMSGQFFQEMLKMNAQMSATPGIGEATADRITAASMRKMMGAQALLKEAVTNRSPAQIKAILENMPTSTGAPLRAFMEKALSGQATTADALDTERKLNSMDDVFSASAQSAPLYSRPRPSEETIEQKAQVFGEVFKDQAKGNLSTEDAWMQALEKFDGDVLEASKWLSTGDGRGNIRGLYSVVNGSPFKLPDQTEFEIDRPYLLDNQGLEQHSGKDYTKEYNKAIRDGGIPAGADLSDPDVSLQFLQYLESKSGSKLKKAAK